uniref:Uncharacterized protein n=1 Tax=Arundo donax TaxID=35708 RepID=A0A0A8ZJN2_ARUDO
MKMTRDLFFFLTYIILGIQNYINQGHNQCKRSTNVHNQKVQSTTIS